MAPSPYPLIENNLLAWYSEGSVPPMVTIRSLAMGTVRALYLLTMHFIRRYGALAVPIPL